MSNKSERDSTMTLDGTTSMYWAGRAAYQSGLTLAANPWDGSNPAEARFDWSWRKGYANAEHDATAREVKL